MAFTDNTTGGRNIVQGILPYKLTLTDTCEVGDLIGYDSISTGAWERADANAKKYANFIAGEPCKTSGDTITVYREAIVSGFTGAVAGDLVYLSDTDGDYAAAPVGNYHQVVGIMISVTEAVIRPDAMPVCSYNTQVTPTGLAEAGFFRTEINDGASASMCGGIKIECKSLTGCDTLSSMRGLYIYMQAAKDTTDGTDLCIVRLEDGGTIPVHSVFELAFTNAAGPSYLIRTTTNSGTMYSKTGTSSTGAGWFKVDCAGTDRYILMYSDTPA